MKITRKQLRKIILEATNYASLENQGMPTLRRIIRSRITPQDVYDVIDQLKSFSVPINAAGVSEYMMIPFNPYYDRIATVVQLQHPSINSMMVDDHIFNKRRPQEIDRSRIAAEIAKIYNDEFIQNYITSTQTQA